MSNLKNKTILTDEQTEELLAVLKVRFEKNMNRHKDIKWSEVKAKLDSAAGKEKLWSLNEMEKTGGEPDVVDFNKKTLEYTFIDCSTESPVGRRNICYDRQAQESRKENKPENNVEDMASTMGIQILTEEDYRTLQGLGNFDTKTSSWIKTPDDIRKLGGALFADFRYGHVFVYHNSATSYYGVRGFRGVIKI